jgi:hypothetical protein
MPQLGGYLCYRLGFCRCFLDSCLHNLGHADHRFRWMPSTRSSTWRPAVPAHGARFFGGAGIGGRPALESGWTDPAFIQLNTGLWFRLPETSLDPAQLRQVGSVEPMSMIL